MVDCDSFIKALLVRFRPNAYDDQIEYLTQSRQNGAVKEYKHMCGG